jgi:hypothetical protein
VELGAVDASGKLLATWETPWDITQIWPARTDMASIQNEFRYTESAPALPKGNYTLVMRVVNPLSNGKLLKFANQTQDQDLMGWVTLGKMAVKE